MWRHCLTGVTDNPLYCTICPPQVNTRAARVVEVKVHYVGHDEVTGSVRVVCVRTGTQTERSRSSARRWSTKIPTQGWYMTSKLRLRGWENSCGLKVSIWIKASHASRSLCVSDCIPGGYVKKFWLTDSMQFSKYSLIAPCNPHSIGFSFSHLCWGPPFSRSQWSRDTHGKFSGRLWPFEPKLSHKMATAPRSSVAVLQRLAVSWPYAADTATIRLWLDGRSTTICPLYDRSTTSIMTVSLPVCGLLHCGLNK